MKTVNLIRVSTLLTILTIGFISNTTIGEENSTWQSRENLFQLSYTSELAPIVINQIHQWTLYIETIDGLPLEGAKITFSGGMPTHNHGMPTAPQVTKEIGNGSYLLEGVRFHMMGYWELQVDIVSETGNISDSVIIPLNL